MASAQRQASGGALAIRLFGHTEMSVDGAAFKFASPRKSLHVLAYLLLHRSAPVTREYLAFILFPDEEESVARTRLRSSLGDLPKMLPAPFEQYVSIDGENVTWNANAPLWLDVDAFVEAAADPARLNEAIELYRGDLLPQIYDEWIESARENYRNAYIRCLSDAASTARRNGDFGHAVETARKILAIDPWREDVIRRIVAMRYESGDRAGALSEYRDFAKRLHAEMKAEPMPETIALAERIARGLDISSADESMLQAALPAKPVLPFVGRRAELSALLEAWNGAARGRGTFAFVGGETGIGKSRLALEFAHVVEERGGRVLTGTTSFPEAVPYESITDALRGALPLLAALKPDVSLAALATIAPEIRDRVTLPDLPRLSPESERIRLFDALANALTRLASQRPVLLLLEDLHWAGAATTDMLQFLVQRVAGKRVMVLVTFRDDEISRTHPLQRLRNEAQTKLSPVNVWLGRLTSADVKELCAGLGGAEVWAAGDLVATSQGHPHFLTQLVLDRREGTHEAESASLDALLSRRLERLSPEARTAAEIAACIGDHFSRDALREVSAWDDTALSGALDELLDRRIVREAPGRGLFEYSFAHHAVHQAVAVAVPAERDKGRRRRVARVLEELYPERVPELSALVARHYDIGGDAENAARAYLAAARYSISLAALEEALSQCERGVQLATDLRLQCELQTERVAIEARRGRREPWDAALLQLERSAAEFGDIEIRRAALMQRFEYGFTCSDRSAAERALHEMREGLRDDETYWQAQAGYAELRLAVWDSRRGEAISLGEKALTYSRRAGDHEITARILCEMAVVEAYCGRLASAAELFRATREAASHAADRTIAALPVRSEVAAALAQRDVPRARELARQWLDLAIELGDRPQQASAHNVLAISIVATGKDVADARRHYAASSELFAEMGAPGGAEMLLNQGVLEARVGFFDRSLAMTEQYLEIPGVDERAKVLALDNLVLLRTYAGRIDAARAAAEEGLALARSLDLVMNEASILENLAVAEASACDFKRALELAQSSLELRARWRAQICSWKTLADTAIWHARLGDIPAAREAARKVLADENAIVNGTDFPTYCYWAAAQILHLDGRDAEAKRALEKGRRLMQATADDLQDEDRNQYLAIPWNADLLAAVENGIWPDPPR